MTAEAVDGPTDSEETPPAEITTTERAVHGDVTLPELTAFLQTWARDRLGGAFVDVRFRAGRIDAVWGVDLEDGRAVVIKAHRTPVDLHAIRASIDAQQTLAAASFPCPMPLAGPDQVDGRVLTAETLLAGDLPDGRDPAVRRLLADGLFRHIEILRARPDLIRRAGAGPSCASTRADHGRLPWILAFNARWQVALIDHGLSDAATIALAQDRRKHYLSLSWR